MADEDRKDFNAMLQDSKDMPKYQTITDQKSIEKYGGSRMYFAPPMDYDRVMRQVPCGKVVTVGEIREYFARKSGADFCVHCGMGKPSAQGGQDALLADSEGKRGIEPKVSRRGRGTEGEAGSGGTYRCSEREDEYPVLCKGLWKSSLYPFLMRSHVHSYSADKNSLIT